MARVRWKFSEAMREAMRRSDYYAELRSQVIAALDSRYSVTLYELGCAHYRRRHPVWSGTTDDFRAVLGVPDTYRDWTDIRRRTLLSAKPELDSLAPFTLDWHEHRQGRAVVRVDLHFHPKGNAARVETEAELRRSRVGRKTRRPGPVEKVD
jgi:plasmid replication initiation protein